MKKLTLIFLFFANSLFAQVAPVESYPDDSASVEHAGVPKGELLKFTFDNSTIFPGTWREVTVYVPAQYRSDKPACVYVNQDGVQWKSPTVFDNLIHAKEMPITIGIFVMFGRVKADNQDIALDRINRSFEYDGLGDAYARFILEEILPTVEKLKTADGRVIRLSKNAHDRAIGGASSGAVCAFTAAWERPDAFSKVFSAIGTYVGLRGADHYPTLIRKTEPKPIRVFLQDGANDLNIYAGDWWKANEMMERALTFAGYAVQHVWAEGGHNGKHGSSVFPSAMRWLWKDWGKGAAKSQKTSNQFLSDLLIENEGWELVGQNYGFTEGTAANTNGEVFYQDIPNGKTYKVDLNNQLTTLNIDSQKASGTVFGADGKRYTCSGRMARVYSYDIDGKEKVIAEDIKGNDLVMAQNGNLYLTVPDGSEKPSKLVLIKPTGEKLTVDEGLKFANGLCLSPDQTQLYVTESASHWVWVYRIKADGTLTHKQKFGWLHVPDTAENAWADGIKCDREGRVYVATRSGVQILDQLGRVNAILPIPSGQASNVCLGGANFDVLYVSANDKVYRRKIKTRGANPFENPIKPSFPKL